MTTEANIAFLIDGFGVGGTELNTARTLDAFARRGVIVTVIHFHKDGPLFGRIASAGHRMLHLPIVPLSSPRIGMRVIALASLLRDQNIAAVHSQDIYSNILGAAATTFFRRVPLISSRRWMHDVPRPGLATLNAWAHRRSTLVLPNARALVSTLREESVDESKVRVHENFIEDSASKMLTTAEVTAWRRDLQIPSGALVVGCVARLARGKRHDILLRAFALVQRQTPHAHLVIVGDGQQREALTEMVREYGLRDSVTLAGTLPNTPLPQQLFDVAVLVSENEGFPNAVVEAAACRVPIVATPVGGVRDVLRNNENGLEVPVGDVEATAASISSLLLDPLTRARMGDAGRAIVGARFSETAAIGRLLSIYAHVAKFRVTGGGVPASTER